MASACSPRASCADRRRKSCPPRADGSNVCGAIRSGPNSGPLPGGRVENGCAGQVCFVETVTLQQHRARPGRPAPSPTRRESRRQRVMRQRPLPPPPGVLGRSYTTGLRGREAIRVGRTQQPIHRRSPRRAPPTRLRLRLRTVPLPIRCANREETRPATHPPIVSISRAANPLTSLAFPKMQRHEPSSLRPPP